jgi:phosphatidylserine decarboxylase
VASGSDGDHRRRAGWLPAQDDLEEWLSRHRERAEQRSDADLHPVIKEFAELIESDSVVRLYVHQMIEQEPLSKPYEQRPYDDVPGFLRLIDETLRAAPEFSDESLVMTPMAAVLDWTIGTPAGFAAYRDPRINAMIKKILDAYGEFLSGPDSRYVLNSSPSGWCSPKAREKIGIEQYEHDENAEHWGFPSWNAFFTRRFRDGQRLVASPDDDAVITNACESTPYGVATDVQRRDEFWIKSQPYSLHDLLAGDPAIESFVGGTVYQAFLSATNYHRWHSPVAGTVVRAFVQPGTYYSEADSEGPGAVEPQHSQSYLAHVATRAIVVIDAANPRIGLIAFVAVGMTDVSSCLLHPDIRPGQEIKKGDELGHFQFGGSTYCLVLRPGVVRDLALPAVPRPGAALVHVNSELARTSAS